MVYTTLPFIIPYSIFFLQFLFLFFSKIGNMHRTLSSFSPKKPYFTPYFVRFSQLKNFFSFSMENFFTKCYHGIYRIGLVTGMV